MARERRGRASGAFFSGGVDSFFTLLRNIRRYPPGDARLIAHLVALHLLARGARTLLRWLQRRVPARRL